MRRDDQPVTVTVGLFLGAALSFADPAECAGSGD